MGAFVSFLILFPLGFILLAPFSPPVCQHYLTLIPNYLQLSLLFSMSSIHSVSLFICALEYDQIFDAAKAKRSQAFNCFRMDLHCVTGHTFKEIEMTAG